MKSLRSVLYMPASNTRALKKIHQLDADAYILDLEDAVSPENKADARACLLDNLQSENYGERRIIARVNGLQTRECALDVAALATQNIEALLFPKIECQQDVLDAIDLMEKHHYSSQIELWVMIETPLAIIDIASIVQAHPRLTTLVMGTSDLAKDMGVPHTSDRLGLLHALSQPLLYAKAYRKYILDGVHLDLSDDQGFVTSCEQGRVLGFDGKTLIHPKQIASCNHAFSPSDAELQEARAIVALWEQMQADKSGVAVLNGKLIEKLHVDQAYGLLDTYA